MQVLLRPLTRQPLTEEEFYELGVEIPRLRFAERLCKLLKRKRPAMKGYATGTQRNRVSDSAEDVISYQPRPSFDS